MNQVLLANGGPNLPAGAVVVLCPVAATNGTAAGVSNISQLQQATVLSPYFCTRHPIPTNNVAPFSEYKTHIQPTIPPIALM